MKLLPLRIDLHVHTWYSDDGKSSLEECILYAKKKGLSGIAVTDHDTVKGVRRALKLASEKEFIIIPGIEVSSSQGHVLGLNITKFIQPNLNLVETVEKIHDAGGIAIAAHPLVFMKTRPLVFMKANPVVFTRLLMKQRATSTLNLDGVEVINASAFPFFLSKRLTQTLAERLNLTQTAGSDAHHASEIGTAYTIVEADSEAEEIVEAIRRGAVIPFGRAISWRTRFKRGASGIKRWI